MYKVYISASTQSENIGVGQYGTEQDRMHQLADRVKYFLETQNKFEVYRNQKGWSLSQTVSDCNSKDCSIFFDNHTNGGVVGAQGTEIFYNGFRDTNSSGYKLAKCVYNRVAPLSPGIDRGIKPDTSLYSTGLYVIQKTNPIAALIETIWHDNITEVNHFVNNIDLYAKAEAMGICDYFGETWIEPETMSLQTALQLMANVGITNSPGGWYNNIENNNIDHQYDQQLLINMAKYLFTKNDAVDVLVKNGVINSPDEWKKTDDYSAAYMKELCIKMGKLLKSRGISI